MGQEHDGDVLKKCAASRQTGWTGVGVSRTSDLWLKRVCAVEFGKEFHAQRLHVTEKRDIEVWWVKTPRGIKAGVQV